METLFWHNSWNSRYQINIQTHVLLHDIPFSLCDISSVFLKHVLTCRIRPRQVKIVPIGCRLLLGMGNRLLARGYLGVVPEGSIHNWTNIFFTLTVFLVSNMAHEIPASRFQLKIKCHVWHIVRKRKQNLCLFAHFLSCHFFHFHDIVYIHVNALRWRHNGRDSVSNHQPHDCLLSRLFRRRSKKTSKLRVTGLCAGNSSVTGEFPAQMASNAENVSIWWRHHGPLSLLARHCPACRTTLVATRFRVAVICPIIQEPHCIRVFFYFVWFVFINHIFQLYYELCTYCNILDIYLS